MVVEVRKTSAETRKLKPTKWRTQQASTPVFRSHHHNLDLAIDARLGRFTRLKISFRLLEARTRRTAVIFSAANSRDAVGRDRKESAVLKAVWTGRGDGGEGTLRGVRQAKLEAREMGMERRHRDRVHGLVLGSYKRANPPLTSLPSLTSLDSRDSSICFSDYPAQDQDIGEISSSALFHKNRNFEINGGTFNLSVQRTEPEFENFRRIRLGDIVAEKNLEGVRRIRKGRNVFRHVYTAKIHGSEPAMTVVMYEGSEKDSKEMWDKYISQHMKLRFLESPRRHVPTQQSFTMAEYESYKQMKDVYSVTPTHRVYFDRFVEGEMIHGCYLAVMMDVRELRSSMYTVWFHPAGKLCFEVHPAPAGQRFGILDQFDEGIPGTKPSAMNHFHNLKTDIRSPGYLLPPVEVSKIIDSLDLEFYYSELIDLRLWHRTIPLARNSNIRPHSVVKDVAGDLQEVAYLQVNPSPPQTWYIQRGNDIQVEPHMMPNGWTRCSGTVEHKQLPDLNFELQLCCGSSEVPEEQFSPFAHANYIASHLRLQCSSYSEEAYWSFDPSGDDCLSPNEALNLALPQASLEIFVSHAFVDEALFKDLHTFHTMKGFNADSQEIAKHLGLPLLYFGDEGDPPPSPLFDISQPDDEGFDSDDLVDMSPFLEDTESDDEQILYPRMTPSI
ncbi:hypothetical protein R3P38DRAFT_3415111 [Favolaschia claudopus]|uniref:Uncharacterized protein n=1 Tax=Favolaschia claudopus TaxID=2862362 RepID=A0AAW0EF43_9AGAR